MGAGTLATDLPGLGLPTRYRMPERLVAIEEDFFIRTDGGVRAFFVDGEAIRTSDTFRFSDLHGTVLCEIRPRLSSIRAFIPVIDTNGNTVVTVERRTISPIRDSFSVDISDGPSLEVRGNVATHDYELFDHRGVIATISKRWFRARDTYGVEIGPGQRDVLILAAIVALDQMVSGPL